MYQEISGFPELSPAEQIAWNRVIETIRKNYELVGAVPIETPAVERISTLEGKGSDDKEIYALRRLAADEGEDDKVALALRFDLTVPMARYVGSHSNDLAFPFKRYQMQPVWRGERSQKGRYRQFQQCDIDVIGDGALSLMNDAEMPAIIFRIFSELNLGEFVISVNNRKILTGFLSQVGFDESKVGKAIKIIDNMEKVGLSDTKEALLTLGANESELDLIIEFFQLSGDTDAQLRSLRSGNYNEVYSEGVEELEKVVSYMRRLGVPDENFKVDVSIARGLDYYTGTVYETRLLSHPGIGSICSGGRYDQLLEKLGSKRALPGVGISIGLSRLFSSLVEAGLVKVPNPTVAAVLVTTLDQSKLFEYLDLATDLRESGIKTELYSEQHKLGKQMKFANKKGFSLVVIAGESEFSVGNVVIRSLSDGNEYTVAKEDLVNKVKELLK